MGLWAKLAREVLGRAPSRPCARKHQPRTVTLTGQDGRKSLLTICKKCGWRLA